MRHLSPREAALWDRVARTVTPIPGKRAGQAARAFAPLPQPVRAGPARSLPAPPPPPSKGSVPARPQPLTAGERGGGLDAGWDRKLARGVVSPDYTLDLHGCTLDAAHARLDHALTLAIAQGARVMLLVTGRARGADEHSGRGERRGAIRAKFLDWLAAGPHASRIAAVRPAPPRHGGAGAVYVVLRRTR